MSDDPPTDGECNVTAVSPADTRNLTQDELMRVIRASVPAAVVGLALLAALYTMYFAAELILPIFLALFLSIILRPIFRGMNRLGIPRTISALVVLIGLVGISGRELINGMARGGSPLCRSHRSKSTTLV